MKASQTFDDVKASSLARSQRWKEAIGHRVRPRNYNGSIESREAGFGAVAAAGTDAANGDAAGCGCDARK